MYVQIRSKPFKKQEKCVEMYKNVKSTRSYGVVARDFGRLATRLTPNKPFSRPVRPKPVLEVKKPASIGLPAAVGFATENTTNAIGSIIQSRGSDDRCKK